MKIIFLDVDGVLNSEVWNQNHKIETENSFLIDKEAIKLLSYLVKTNKAKKKKKILGTDEIMTARQITL